MCVFVCVSAVSSVPRGSAVCEWPYWITTELRPSDQRGKQYHASGKSLLSYDVIANITIIRRIVANMNSNLSDIHLKNLKLIRGD